MKLYYWLVWKINTFLARLLYPGLGRQYSWRYEKAIGFWARSYWYAELWAGRAA